MTKAAIFPAAWNENLTMETSRSRAFLIDRERGANAGPHL